jgi:hypothetical protein
MNRATKATAVFLLCMGVSFSGFSQEKKEPNKNMPPIHMLPKVGEGKKVIHELPKETDYKVYDVHGQIIEENSGKWIDITAYPVGDYFIKYEGTTTKLERRE